MEKYVVDTAELAKEIYDMMKENDKFRDTYKGSIKDSAATTDRIAAVGEIFGKAIDRKLHLLELLILDKEIR